MGWLFRNEDIHKCEPPAYDTKGTKVGDIWECDEPTCKKKWVVSKINYDQRDGDWLDFRKVANTNG